MSLKLPKIVAVVGPTASGKTSFGIEFAKKFKGEIISVDSRQIYKGMDIGTAKTTGIWEKDEIGRFYLDVEGVKHYGIDLINPDKVYSVAEFKDYALVVIKEILERGYTPFLVGGTGFYLQVITENLEIPRIAADEDLRAELERKDLTELVGELQEVDLESYKKIDLKNRRRVVRALEVFYLSNKSFVAQKKAGPKLFEVLKIGLDWPREELYKKIDERVEGQLDDGLIEETKKLEAAGFRWNLPSMSGIGYQEIGIYLRGGITLEKAKELIKFRTHDYARRQLTWFRKDKEIRWVKNFGEAYKLTKDFLRE